MDGLFGREACFDEQLDFALVPEAGEHASVASGVGTREQQASGFGEGELEVHLFAHELSHGRVERDAGAGGEVALRGFGGHGVEGALLKLGRPGALDSKTGRVDVTAT